MAAAEKGKKKRAPLSSFTILLIILVVLAIVTVIMSASGVEGVQGATLSQVLTAPVFGFQDAIGVCLFVMILGGFLGIVTETGALDAGHRGPRAQAEGQRARAHPGFDGDLLHRRHHLRHVRGNGALLPAARRHHGGRRLRQPDPARPWCCSAPASASWAPP